MGKVTGIKKNSAFVLATHILRLIANSFLFIGLARFYGPTEFGQFTAAHTLSTIFVILADFGFDVLLVTEVARQKLRATEIAQRYLSMKLIFSFAASCLMLGFAYLQDVSPATKNLMYLFSLYVLLSALMNFFFALFRAVEEMHHETRISFFMNAILVMVALFLGVYHAPLWLIAAVFIGSRFIGLILAIVEGERLVSLRSFKLVFGRPEDLVQMSVFGLHALFGNLFFVQDTILLSWWAGDHQVGVYQAVFKVVVLGLMISDVSFYAILPVLSRLHRENTGQWIAVGRLLHKTLLFVSLPIAFVCIVFADQVIGILYGAKAYEEAVPLLRVFGW
ncbi:MAG: oligosaccharide flippase family protein, partial [Bacteroidota bacterium]